MKDHPFLEYACDYWPVDIHNKRTRAADSLTDKLLAEFFDPNKPDCFVNWASIYDPPTSKQYEFEQQAREETSLPTTYTAKFHLNNLTQRYLESGLSPDASSHHHRCPLQMASLVGNEQSARLLLDHGANINNFGFSHHTALIAAVRARNESIARLLIEKGIDVDQSGWCVSTALSHAIEFEQYGLVKLLLDGNASVNISVGLGLNTALDSAILLRNPLLVKTLLDYGANSSQSSRFGSALHTACESSDLGMAALLLDYGIDANSSAGPFGDVLQNAVIERKVDIAELLLARGADPNIKGNGHHGSPLHCAVSALTPYLIELLVSYGANVNTVDDEHGSVLYHAVKSGVPEIVTIFLEHDDINLEQDGGRWGKPLYAALERGLVDVVDLFVNEDEYEEMLAAGYGNALYGSAFIGNERVLSSLIMRGNDVNSTGKLGSALQAACFASRYTTTKLLLESGADVNLRGGEYETALQAACVDAEDAILDLLLSRPEMDTNIVGGKYGSALNAIPYRKGRPCSLSDMLNDLARPNPADNGLRKRAQDAELILNHNRSAAKDVSCNGTPSRVNGPVDASPCLTNVNLHGPPYGCPLMAACVSSARIGELSNVLISHGANVNCHCSDEYGSPLQAIVYCCPRRRSIDPIKLMLQAGADPFYGDTGKHGSVVEMLARDDEKFKRFSKVLLDAGIDFSRKGQSLSERELV